MTDTESLAAYIAEISGGRAIAPRLRDTLLQLLLTPRARGRYPSLTEEEIRAVAERFISEPPTKPLRRRRIA